MIVLYIFVDAKCEFMNPSGSAKDRIALAMLQDAEKGGFIKEDSKFVEPTSGNTGIGIAFNSALMGTKNNIIIIYYLTPYQTDI